MADTFGRLELPAPLIGEGDAAGDPFLDILGSAVQAVVNSRLGALWNQLAPGTRPIENVRKWDPKEGLADKDLPALFVWRTVWPGAEWLAQDYYLARSSVTMMWVPPRVTQDKRNVRSAIPNAIYAAIHLTVERFGQDDSWVDPADPSPSNSGSLMWGLFGIYSMDLMRGERVPIVIDMLDSKQEPQKRQGFQMILDVRERIGDDLDTRYDDLMGVEGDVLNDDLTRQSFIFKLRATRVVPNTGATAGGEDVLIVGTGFAPGPSVTFGGTTATNIATSDDGVAIACTTPAHAAGAVDVVVTNPSDETATITAGFTYS